MRDLTTEDVGDVTIDTGEFPELIPIDPSNPDALFEHLIRAVKQYHPSGDLTLINEAYLLAKDAHKNQYRKSGEPYVFHPISVGIVLAHLELDKETIVAGLLHDVVEDTEYTTKDIEEKFGQEIALLVDGVTKLTQLNYSGDKVEEQVENLRKMFLAMAKDIRVILIKLADRLHNMRTLASMKPEKQKEKSRETMDIYAPIADRLGISKLKVELDDLSFRYLEPDEYKELTSKLSAMRTERESFINDIVADVKSHIDELRVGARIDGRVKHYFSMYRKMKKQNKSLEQIYDLFVVRIIVHDVQQCYAALGIIHEMYKPIPGRFKDYIAMPKPNMYQSLHTTMIGPGGQPFEIQIRTFDMHRVAEYGIAAHWKYKEDPSGESTSLREEEKMAWLKQILEWQREMSDNKEFLSVLKSDLNLFSDNVFCFTPKGDVKNLPNGSTTVDFAYGIHSAVGNKMVGARVNGKLVDLEYVIQNGDQIEILTSQNSKGPSRDWLSLVRSTQAKNKINQWFKDEFKEENIIRGKELLHAHCMNKGIALSDLLKPEYMEACMKKYGFHIWDSVCAAIGHGGLKEGQVVNRLLEEYEKTSKREMTDEQVLEVIEGAKGNLAFEKDKQNGGVTVKGVRNAVVRFSKCCSPVPGDEVIGFVTRGRGVSVHRTDCANILHLSEGERKRLVEAEWQDRDEKEQSLYVVGIVLYTYNRRGILMDVSKVFNEHKIDVKSMNVRTSKQGTATIMVEFEIQGVERLNYIVSRIRKVEGVIDIERI